MKTPRLLVAATAAALLLAGCGTKDTAAIVDGHRISESAVLETTAQINAHLSEGMTATTVVQQLVVAPTVVDVLAERGVTVTDAAARSQISSVPSPTPYLLDLVRLQLGVNELTPDEFATVTQRLTDLNVSVSPRFGKLDPETFVIEQVTPDWIAGGA